MKANRPRSRKIVNRSVHRWMQGTVGGALMVMLASCAPPPRPVAPAPMRPASLAPMTAPPAPAAARTDWRDAPITPGDWHWAREGSDSVARFGPPGASLIALRCIAANHMVVMDVAGTGSGTLGITTSSMSRSLLAQQRGGWLEATLSARDPLLDAMAFSRGRFVVEAAGSAVLYLPSWPEVSRVIEDCR